MTAHDGWAGGALPAVDFLLVGFELLGTLAGAGEAVVLEDMSMIGLEMSLRTFSSYETILKSE